MIELCILKANMDILHSLPYITVNILNGGSISNTSVVSYAEIIRHISATRKKLKDEGFIYINGRLKKIS